MRKHNNALESTPEHFAPCNRALVAARLSLPLEEEVMLYSLEQDSIVTRIPHESDYWRWRNRLSEAEYQSIVESLDSEIDGGEIHTSSWIPGSDWSDTPYQAIYEKACDYDETQSGKCFGLFLWVVLMERPEWWAFGRYEKNGVPIEGLTYFTIDDPR